MRNLFCFFFFCKYFSLGRKVCVFVEEGKEKNNKKKNNLHNANRNQLIGNMTIRDLQFGSIIAAFFLLLRIQSVSISGFFYIIFFFQIVNFIQWRNEEPNWSSIVWQQFAPLRLLHWFALQLNCELMIHQFAFFSLTRVLFIHLIRKDKKKII